MPKYKGNGGGGDKGKGRHRDKPPSCPRCGGDGEVVIDQDGGKEKLTCPLCKGSGEA